VGRRAWCWYASLAGSKWLTGLAIDVTPLHAAHLAVAVAVRLGLAIEVGVG
jgi:hypothetical protein